MDPLPVSLDTQRERVVEALSAHYAEDHLTTQELELRFDRAYRARTSQELTDVLAGLPALANGAKSPQPRLVPVPAPSLSDQPERRYVAVMSTLRKAGNWTPARTLVVRAVMSDVKIDLRDATFVDHEVDFDVVAVMAETKIIVPPGVRVECHGSAVLGEFSDKSDRAAQDPSAPLVRVHGTSVMANVTVVTRMPGESRLEARRRARLARSDD